MKVEQIEGDCDACGKDTNKLYEVEVNDSLMLSFALCKKCSEKLVKKIQERLGA